MSLYLSSQVFVGCLQLADDIAMLHDDDENDEEDVD